MHFGILSEKLRERHHHVVTLCPAQSRTYADLVSKHLQPINFSVSGYFHPLAVIKLAKLLKDSKIDVIHAHLSRDLWTIVPAARMAGGIPIVLIKHIGTRKPKRDLFHCWIYRHVCYIVAISDVIARNVINTHPVPAEKVGIVHHGLDLSKFKNKNSGRLRVRKEFGFDDNDIVIGTIGRLQEGKGHLEFLEMARRISNKWPKTRFLLVGEPTLGEAQRAQTIYKKAEEINLGNRLVMPGFRKDVPDILAAMDVFAFPSHAEAFGLVVIEAMAAGLAIVSSNCDGVLDIIADGKTGLLVPPKNADKLTKAIEFLIEHPQKRKALAQMAQQQVEERFAIDVMVDQVERIYKDCITHPSR